VAFKPNDYEFTITTPFRANGGVAVTLGKNGFVTGDVEYVGYGQARLRPTEDDVDSDDFFSDQNSDIRSLYKSTVNLRFGAEGRFDIFRVRAGYARYGNPYKSSANSGQGQNFYTGGVGIRQGSFFIDAAAAYTTFDQYYAPYTISNQLEPVVQVNNTRFTTTLTAGITF
jgi:hypothetical protein